ncbi:hypothetical protein FPV67DRAFT_1356633, partial [Lyophyllum atratum]
ITYAEVSFYFFVSTRDSDEMDDLEGDREFSSWALVSVYSDPIPEMLTDSFGTLWACSKGGHANLQAIPASDILSLVSMQPMPAFDDEPRDLWFVVEK